MSQLYDFFAGDAEVIGRAFEAHDFGTLQNRRRIPFHANFSLHLSLVDFDLLASAANSIVGGGPTAFLDDLGEPVGGRGSGDEWESAAYVVPRAYVEMFARVPEAAASEFCRRWMVAVVGEDPVVEEGSPATEVTADALKAVRDLVALCRFAIQQGTAVVFTWSL